MFMASIINQRCPIQLRERLDYLMMPSLKFRSLTRIAVSLWNHDDARYLASEIYFSSSTHSHVSEKKKVWLKVENEVILKATKLPIPSLLIKELTRFIAAVGWEFLLWLDFHENRCNVVSRVPNDFCWTSQGTIDKRRTALMLIKDENLDILKRYKLACIYCLENDICALWNQMGSERDFRNLELQQPSLVYYWSLYIEGKIHQLDPVMRRCCLRDVFTPYEYAFRRAVGSGNEVATRFFFQKLNAEEKGRLLARTAGEMARRRGRVSERTDFPKEHYTDVLCFLLNSMSKEQQVEVFRANPFEVLKCLIDWPWQHHFLKTAECLWDILPNEDFHVLLGLIINKVIHGYKDHDYQQLFGEFWQQSPAAFKRFVINRCTSGFLLSDLFEVGNKQNIALILKDATVEKKEELILCARGKTICTRLILKGNWELLRFFVVECILSKKKALELKEEFEKRHTWFQPKERFISRERIWSNFFTLMDDLLQKDSEKQNSEPMDDNSSERLCSSEFKDVAECVKDLVEMCVKGQHSMV